MKIRIAYRAGEEKTADKVVKLLKALMPLKVKESPEVDGYIHIYLSTISVDRAIH